MSGAPEGPASQPTVAPDPPVVAASPPTEPAPATVDVTELPLDPGEPVEPARAAAPAGTIADPAPVRPDPAPTRPAPPVLRDWPGDGPTSEPIPGVPAAAAPAPTPAAVAWPPAAWPPQASTPATPRPPTGAVAGAYLAPSASYSAAVPRATPATPSPGPSGVRSAAAIAIAPPTTGRRGLAVPAELAEWFSIGGSVLVIVSFVLPWATDGVIGSRGSGYTAEWGLANPGHLLLILAALIILVLHIVPNRVPRWIRSGVLPLLVGGVLLGLAFAYYAKPFGGGTGVAVELAGALVLVGGGLLGIPPERNEPASPGV